MKVIHVANHHRFGGGSDNVWNNLIRVSAEIGLDVHTFERDSRNLPAGLSGRIKAFTDGLYPRRTLADFRDVLHQVRPDIVHTHELFPMISPWVLKEAKRFGLPVVHHCYDYRMSCPVATHLSHGRFCDECHHRGEHRAVINNCRSNFAESAAFAARNMLARKLNLYADNVDHFITLSEFHRQWLTDWIGIDPGRISVSSCTVDLPETAADATQGEYVAYAGRFAPEKGIDILLEAIRLTGLPLKLSGNSETETPINTDMDVEFVMTSSSTELADFYRGARFLVVPSIWWESFGIVAAEAMSHGVPVIASRVGALQNTVSEGETGLLFEMGNAIDLAQQMEKLWYDADLVKRFGQASRIKAMRDFNQASHLRPILDCYHELTNKDVPEDSNVRRQLGLPAD